MKIRTIIFSLMTLTLSLNASETASGEPTEFMSNNLSLELEKADELYDKKDFIGAEVLYTKIAFAIIPQSKDIKEESQKLSREALIVLCDAFRGRLRCYLANGNEPDKFWMSQAELVQSIDPRKPFFEIHDDHTIVHVDEIISDEELENVKKMLSNENITRISDTDLMIQDEPCDSCCESCSHGGECEDDEHDIDFEQNIEKKSSK